MDDRGFLMFDAHMAGRQLLDDVLGDYDKLPLEAEPPLESLPVDEEPWFGGLLPLVCTSPVTRLQHACLFFFWGTERDIVGLDFGAELERIEAAGSLSDTMHAPLVGPPRRPTRIITSDVMALMLRAGAVAAFDREIDSFLTIEVASARHVEGRIRRAIAEGCVVPPLASPRTDT